MRFLFFNYLFFALRDRLFSHNTSHLDWFGLSDHQNRTRKVLKVLHDNFKRKHNPRFLLQEISNERETQTKTLQKININSQRKKRDRTNTFHTAWTCSNSLNFILSPSHIAHPSTKRCVIIFKNIEYLCPLIL